MRLPGSGRALKKNHRVGAEFVDYLAARATRRAGDAVIVSDGDGGDFDLGSEGGDGGENGGALGAVGHAVGSVLDVASGEDFSAGEQNCGAYVKIGVRGVSVFHDFCSGTLELFSGGGGNGFLSHDSLIWDAPL